MELFTPFYRCGIFFHSPQDLLRLLCFCSEFLFRHHLFTLITQTEDGPAIAATVVREWGIWQQPGPVLEPIHVVAFTVCTFHYMVSRHLIFSPHLLNANSHITRRNATASNHRTANPNTVNDPSSSIPHSNGFIFSPLGKIIYTIVYPCIQL